MKRLLKKIGITTKGAKKVTEIVHERKPPPSLDPLPGPSCVAEGSEQGISPLDARSEPFVPAPVAAPHYLQEFARCGDADPDVFSDLLASWPPPRPNDDLGPLYVSIDGPTDVGPPYAMMEDATRLCRLEEPKNFLAALRLLVRQQHPSGNRVLFPVPEIMDRLQLRCDCLPTEAAELRGIIERVLLRRHEKFDIEAVYQDFVKSHGRCAFEPSRPWPECYAVVRL